MSMPEAMVTGKNSLRDMQKKDNQMRGLELAVVIHIILTVAPAEESPEYPMH